MDTRLSGWVLMRLYYPFLRRFGLGAHLAVIIALAAVPTSLVVIEFIDAQRREAIEDARDWARNAAAQVAEHHRQAISAAHGIVAASAVRIDYAAASARPCAVPAGRNEMIWLVGPDGQSVCSSDPRFPLSRDVFDGVVRNSAEPGFSIVGPYLSGSGRPQVFGVLTRRAPDGVVWHVARAIDLEWMPSYDEDLAGPADLVVMAVDDQGEILHRMGSGAELLLAAGAATPRAVAPVEASMDAGAPTLVDVDGVHRIFGTAALPETGGAVMVGVSHDAVLAAAQRELFASLALFGSVLTLSGLVAWLVIERMVLRAVRRLRDAAVATSRGEPAPRVEITDGPVELRELASAFNDMKDKLEFQALHDQLTGLGNRRYIENRMGALLADARPFAVMAIDLDGFKPINDTYGHAVGDFVLAEAARRLKSGLGDGLFLGRTGGDEFLAGVALDGARRRDIAAKAAERMLKHLARPIRLADGTQVTISGSVGIAFWLGNGATTEEVIREADSALYRAKKDGRNRFVVPDAA